MAAIPNTIRLSAFSLKTTQAMAAVKTASRFNSRDALDPLVVIRPNIKATGPATPPKKMAPNNQGHSARVNPDACQPRSRTRRMSVSPNPLPRYSNPASSTGGMFPTSSLAKGVLAPNRAAANRA